MYTINGVYGVLDMRYLLVGDYKGNNGPNNVNKQIIQHKSRKMMHVDFTKRFMKFPDTFLKLLVSKVVVVSGISRPGVIAIKAAKILGKKTAYIMHGCAVCEAEINGRVLSERDLRWERELLETADLLLPVSKRYSQWARKQFPQHAHKTSFWRFGVVKYPYKNVEREDNSIVAADGGDANLKNNRAVSNAVERLNGQIKMRVYGTINDLSVLSVNTHTEWLGKVPHDKYLDDLRKASVYIVNSRLESFNISVMEALSCGCSILMSTHVGASEILDLTENDMIFDVDDENEIANKIQYLLEHPNHKRIYSKLDWNQHSPEKAVRRLEQICEELGRSGSVKQEINV